MENTLEAYKGMRRIIQEYFAIYGVFADRHEIEPLSANFRPKPKKFFILLDFLDRIEWVDKPSHDTVPLISNFQCQPLSYFASCRWLETEGQKVLKK
jgi:hypothetical protein